MTWFRTFFSLSSSYAQLNQVFQEETDDSKMLALNTGILAVHLSVLFHYGPENNPGICQTHAINLKIKGK